MTTPTAVTMAAMESAVALSEFSATEPQTQLPAAMPPKEAVW